MNEINIIQPDDWHVHFRDNEILKLIAPETKKIFGKCIVMPNLVPPVVNSQKAKRYKKEIIDCIGDNLKIYLTLYLTENLTKSELLEAFFNNDIFAVKLYPLGATTNSNFGIKNIKKIMPILELMSLNKIPLLIHGEDVDPDIDIFDREKSFIDKYLTKIVKDFPELKITLEHITTKEAVDFVLSSNNNIVASITPHHLASDRNSMLVGGIKPHLYCLPILKRRKHRDALVKIATSGNKKFFLGTDSAPHLKHDKESECGCAGVFNTKYCMQTLTQLFDDKNCLNNLESFTSLNGTKHYQLPVNKKKIKLIKSDKPIKFNKFLKKNNIQIKNYIPDFQVFWSLKKN